MERRTITQLTQSLTVLNNAASIFVIAGKGPFRTGAKEFWKTYWVLGKGTMYEEEHRVAFQYIVPIFESLGTDSA